MTMSVNMRKVHARAELVDAALRADDRRFTRAVRVQHEDGTSLFFNFAFVLTAEEAGDDYVVVFTEHNGFHVFAASDLAFYQQYQPIAMLEMSENSST